MWNVKENRLKLWGALLSFFLFSISSPVFLLPWSATQKIQLYVTPYQPMTWSNYISSSHNRVFFQLPCRSLWMLAMSHSTLDTDLCTLHNISLFWVNSTKHLVICLFPIFADLRTSVAPNGTKSEIPDSFALILRVFRYSFLSWFYHSYSLVLVCSFLDHWQASTVTL